MVIHSATNTSTATRTWSAASRGRENRHWRPEMQFLQNAVARDRGAIRQLSRDAGLKTLALRMVAPLRKRGRARRWWRRSRRCGRQVILANESYAARIGAAADGRPFRRDGDADSRHRSRGGRGVSSKTLTSFPSPGKAWAGRRKPGQLSAIMTHGAIPRKKGSRRHHRITGQAVGGVEKTWQICART